MTEENDCLECGKKVPYQGMGRPRTRHEECLDNRRRAKRKYMKGYMRKYYARGDNMKKQKELMKRRRNKNEESER